MKKSKPKPSTPPGTNSSGRTYEEQMDFERSERAKNIGKGEKNLVEQIFTKKTPLKKGETFKVMKGSPNMAKRMALKKKMGK
jgi:hypothetical protein